MSRSGELVHEFREIVDTVIQNQVENAGNRSWSGMHEQVITDKLQFVSVDGQHGRSSAVGRGLEHRWGIVHRKMRLGNYAASVALVSMDGQSESLLRRVSVVSSYLPGFPTETERLLEEESELELAVGWARSPHLYPQNLSRLARLLPEEKAQIDARQANDGEAERRLHQDLDNIARSRRAATADSHNIIIG